MAKNMWKRRAGWRDREFYPWFAASSATLLAAAAIAGAGCIFIPGANQNYNGGFKCGYKKYMYLYIYIIYIITYIYIYTLYYILYLLSLTTFFFKAFLR